MNKKKYFEFLNNMSLTKLKSFLGNDIQEELIKWSSAKEDVFSKKKTIALLDSLYGNQLFENQNFRKELLLHSSEQILKEIQKLFFKGKEKDELDLNKIAENISKKTWGKNDISFYLANLWGLNTNIFEKETIISESSFSSKPYDEFYELLDYQYIIKQKANYILNSDKILQKILIQMPTGTGKTKTAMHIIASHYSFTLKNEGLIVWIAHTKELIEQASDTFKNVWSHLGNREVKCYNFYDGNDFPDLPENLEGVAFCSIQTLQSIFLKNSSLKDKLVKSARLVVFDEAHKALAKKTKKVIDSFMTVPRGGTNRALIGLTATPGRTTDESSENYWLSNMFDRNVITIEPELINKIKMGVSENLNTNTEKNIIKYFQDRKILSTISVKKLQYKQSFSEYELEQLKKQLDLDLESEKDVKPNFELLAKDRSRNEAILKCLYQLDKDKIPTIVFACSVAHAKLLSAMLTLTELPNVLVHGGLSKVERENAIKKFKDKTNDVNIIINYGVLTTGFDAKNIRCVFITRPTKSIVLYSQMIGRGLRGPQMGGNEECLLIDIEDNINSYDYKKAFSHFDNYWK